MRKNFLNSFGFTTVELLVTVTIMAVLAILVVVVINPVDLLRQGKDSNRMAGLNSVNGALRFLTENEPGTFIGTSSVVYVSVPDTSPICANLGLPTLPSGWAYGCVQGSSSTRIDGTGWIPVNFSALPAGSPISQLPIDSKNTTSTRNYFTYVGSGKTWELNFTPEATKNKLGGDSKVATKDGGDSPSLVELGSNLFSSPIDYGDSSLVGYWSFEEATGTIAYDKSGNGNAGTLQNSPTWTDIPLCKIGRCLEFNGLNNYVSIPKAANLYSGIMDFSIIIWLYQNNAGSANILAYTPISSWTDNVQFFIDGTKLALWGVNSFVFQNNHGLSIGAWHQYVMVRSENTFKTYVDGVQVGSGVSDSRSLSSPDSTYNIGTIGAATTQFYNGRADDIRIYNRALSSTEVLAIYNSAR